MPVGNWSGWPSAGGLERKREMKSVTSRQVAEDEKGKACTFIHHQISRVEYDATSYPILKRAQGPRGAKGPKGAPFLLT